MTHRIERHAEQRHRLWQLLAAAMPAALANLDDNLPGYSQGAASNSGGGKSTTSSTVSPVERISDSNDRAFAAWTRIQAIDDALDKFHHLEKELYELITTWAYPTGSPKEHHAKLATVGRDEFCSSCLRIKQCVVRYRGDLCRWCYDFQAAEQRLPAVELLQAHHDGRKITTTMVRQTKRGRR